MRNYLAPLALIYAAGVKLRAAGFSKGLLKTTKADVPVISIGNITAGGTGKTPITKFLARKFATDQKRVSILSRGYKGKVKGVEEVNSAGDAARFGDEPAMLARELSGVARVFVGTKKVDVAQQAQLNSDLLIADDAFQHRYLYRDFDLIVVDATEPLEHYFPLPWGQGRESFSSLKRAHAIVLNKVNLAPESWLKKIRALIKDNLNPKIPIFEVGYIIREVESLKSGEKIDLEELAGQKILLVSGIGRPKAFERLLQNKNFKIAAHKIFPDHHKYSQKDFAAIESEATKLKVDLIITTEKDAIKFKNWSPSQPVFISKLELESVQLEELYETIRRTIFPSV